MRPRVIYDAKPGSPLEVDRERYGRLARETGRRTLVDRFVVPRRTGRRVNPPVEQGPAPRPYLLSQRTRKFR